MRILFTGLGASTLVMLAATSSALGQHSGADPSCQPVQATLNALDQTSRFQEIGSLILDGEKTPSVIIAVGNALYTGDGTHWSKMPQTPAERMQSHAKLLWSFSGCRKTGSESIHGEAADVYQAHMENKNPDSRQDVKIWVSAKSGLPLRIDTETGGDKSSFLITYGADIRAPAVPSTILCNSSQGSDS